MLYVHFQLGPNRYALDARSVIEVVPLLELKPLPAAPRGMAGIFVYRGRPVPAIDLCALTLGRPAHAHLNTRILIVQRTGAGKAASDESQRQPPAPPNSTLAAVQWIGFIAERVAGTVRREEKDFVDIGGKMAAAPFLGPVLMDTQGIIQILDAQKLLDAGAHPLQLPPLPEASDAPH